MKRLFIACVFLLMCNLTYAGGFTGITDGNDRVDVLEDGSLPVTVKDMDLDTIGSIPIIIADPLEPNGSLPVTLQDQTTPPVIVPFSQTIATSYLAVATTLDDYTITVADSTGFVAGNLIGIGNIDTLQVWFGRQIGAPSGNIISVDRPLDGTIPANAVSVVTSGNTNMNVDGSGGTQTFVIRTGDPNFPIDIDITRIIITLYTDGVGDLATFGDLTALTKGVTIRRVDGITNNILNFKSNGDIAGMAYDMQFYSASNPQQGTNGLAARLTFGGQSKMGVVLRIGAGENLECLINDDLEDIIKFEIIAEGSIALP